MRTVKLTFVGDASDEIAQRFYTWLVDGGLEDSLIDTLSDDKVLVDGVGDFNNDTLEVAVTSVYRTP